MNSMRVIAICHNVPKRTKDNKGDLNPRGISAWTQNSGSPASHKLPTTPILQWILMGVV